MARLLDELIAQVISLEVRLWACAERLAVGTDAEALHDMRVATRRLRSLLHPLRGLPAVDALSQAAAELAALSGPLRDTEVLIDELRGHGLEHLAAVHEERLRLGCVQLLLTPEWERLLRVLEAWPYLMRICEREGLLNGLGERVDKALMVSRQRLCLALSDPEHDRHRLRLLIKRMRYGLEAYPGRVGLPCATLRLLVGAQAVLGTWHDRFQWLAMAEDEVDLRPRVRAWRMALHGAEVRAERVLEKLSRHLKRH